LSDRLPSDQVLGAAGVGDSESLKVRLQVVDGRDHAARPVSGAAGWQSLSPMPSRRNPFQALAAFLRRTAGVVRARGSVLREFSALAAGRWLFCAYKENDRTPAAWMHAARGSVVFPVNFPDQHPIS